MAKKPDSADWWKREKAPFRQVESLPLFSVRVFRKNFSKQGLKEVLRRTGVIPERLIEKCVNDSDQPSGGTLIICHYEQAELYFKELSAKGVFVTCERFD